MMGAISRLKVTLASADLGSPEGALFARFGALAANVVPRANTPRDSATIQAAGRFRESFNPSFNPGPKYSIPLP